MSLLGIYKSFSLYSLFSCDCCSRSSPSAPHAFLLCHGQVNPYIRLCALELSQLVLLLVPQAYPLAFFTQPTLLPSPTSRPAFLTKEISFLFVLLLLCLLCFSCFFLTKSNAVRVSFVWAFPSILSLNLALFAFSPSFNSQCIVGTVPHWSPLPVFNTHSWARDVILTASLNPCLSQLLAGRDIASPSFCPFSLCVHLTFN